MVKKIPARRQADVVMVFGTFDILHLGHIHMFEGARQHGDKLVAVVARDVNIKKKRLFHNERARLELLRHIKLVDSAVLGDKKDFYKIIKAVKPEAIALGYDQKPDKRELALILSDKGLGKIKLIQLQPYHQRKFRSREMRKYVEKNI